MSEYKSNYTGQEIDNAVEKFNSTNNILTEDDILQTTGTSANKTMSQAAISALITELSSQIAELRNLINNG